MHYASIYRDILQLGLSDNLADAKKKPLNVNVLIYYSFIRGQTALAKSYFNRGHI